MEDELKPQITLKTPEQLKKQVAFVNIDRSLSIYNSQPLQVTEELFQSGPDNLKAMFNTERERIKKEGGTSELIDNYNAFLKTLRKIRQEQKPQVDEEMKKIEDLPSRRETYLKAVSWSGPLQNNIIEKMQNNNTFSTTLSSIFTDEQIEKAKQGEKEFLELVDYGLERSPESLFHAIDQLEFVLPKEKVRSILNILSEKEPYTFIQDFDKVAKYFNSEERKIIFLKAQDADPNKTTVFSHFKNPTISQLFTKEEGRELLIKASKTAYSYVVEESTLDYYIHEGFLTEEDVREMIIVQLQNTRRSITDMDMTKLSKYFSQEKDMTAFKAEITRSFTRKEDPAGLYNIDKIEKILSVKEIQIIIRERINKDQTDVGNSLDTIIKYLPHEEIKSILISSMDKQSINLFIFSSSLKIIFSEGLFTPDEQLRFLDIGIDKHASILLHALINYENLQVPGGREAVIKQLVEKADVGTVVSNLDHWINYFTTDPTEQKSLISKLILKENSFTFIEAYNFQYEKNTLRNLFSTQEIKEFLYKQLELGAGNAFMKLKSIRDLLGNDKDFKTFIKQAAKEDPYYFLSSFKEISYLYNTDEVKNIIETASINVRGVAACIGEIDNWGSILGKDYTWNFLKKFRLSQAPLITTRLDRCLSYVPENERKEFLEDLIKANPPAAMYQMDLLKPYYPNLTEENIITIGKTDQERFSYAPKSLGDFYKNIMRVKDVEGRNSLFIEAGEIYLNISFIDTLGLGHDYRKIQSSQDISAKKEEELLSIFSCYSLIKDKDPVSFAHLESLGNNLDEATTILFNELSRRMGLEREITGEERKRFLDMMTSPAPFLNYYLQYESSDEHKKLLKGIFQGIVNNQYSEWKFGKADIDEFERFKNEKLIPKTLTYEQYSLWRKDESTTLHDTLTADSHTVASAIRQLLLENNQHLQVEAFDMKEMGTEEIFREIQTGLNTLGQELARVNKRLSELRKSSEGAKTSEFEELSQKRIETEDMRKKLLKNRDFMKIATLKPQEVSSGYLLEGEDLKKKVAIISKVLNELRIQTPQEGQFVFERIEQLIQGLQIKNQEKQNLVCTDSSSPKLLMEIGSKPVSSCQHYAHGSHNDCLLGYSDPNTKILILKNEKGNLVARSIFRLLTSKEGRPALHIEKIYSASASPGVLRSIYTHAFNKAQELGVSLFVSQESQNAEGIEVGVEVSEGFGTQNVEQELISEASRAPKVYVDSVGGVRSWGNYTMSNLLEVKRLNK